MAQPETLATALLIARTHLNDEAGTVWSDAQLIPKLQTAFREMIQRLLAIGSPALRFTTEFLVPTPISFWNSTNITDPAFPTGMIHPIALWEKATGDPVTSYIPMTEQIDPPAAVNSTTFTFWAWNSHAIVTRPCTSNRNVKMVYRYTPDVPTTVLSTLFLPMAEHFVAVKGAAIAAASLGNERAIPLAKEAEEKFALLLSANRGSQSPTLRPAL